MNINSVMNMIPKLSTDMLSHVWKNLPEITEKSIKFIKENPEMLITLLSMMNSTNNKKFGMPNRTKKHKTKGKKTITKRSPSTKGKKTITKRSPSTKGKKTITKK
jgi:hypothetical protein